MSRETDRLLEEIREVLRDIDHLARDLLRRLFSLPVQVVFTDTQGVPVTTVSLNGTDTADVPVLVGDVNGQPIPGDLLDPGSAAVSVADPTVASAVLSPDQTSLAVTALDTTSTTTAVVTGTFGGATLTPGNLTVDTTASAPPPPAAAEIVFGDPVVRPAADAAAPAAPAADTTGSGHGSEAGGQAPA